jgi:hypothetical protein
MARGCAGERRTGASATEGVTSGRAGGASGDGMESQAGSAWAAAETDCKTAADFFPKKKKTAANFSRTWAVGGPGPGAKKRKKQTRCAG